MMYIALLELMEEKHISQTAIEKKAHVSRQTIKLYKERRVRQISTRTLEKLCEVLDCTPNDLIRITPNE